MVQGVTSSDRERLLIIVDDWSVKGTHSLVFDYLSDKFDVTVRTDEDISLHFNIGSDKSKSLDINKFRESPEEYMYDHVMLLAPSINSFKSSDMSLNTLLEFFDNGGNIYLGLDSTSKRLGRELAKKFGAELFPAKSNVRGGNKSDGLQASAEQYDNLNGHNLAWSSNLFDPIRQSIADFSTPVAYRGTGMKLDENNAYVFPILSGDEHVFSTNPDYSKKDSTSSSMKTAGNDITLLAGYQSRYNQRVVISGSIDMCSDDLISVASSESSDYSTSSNWILCKNALDWNFQQKSVLKAENMHHELLDKSLFESGHQNSQEYKLKDYIHFEIDILEKVDGEWVPYISDDIQFEFIMLNPYWRVFLENTHDARYELDFRAPDWNGVYKFLVDYNRFGYTRLHEETTAPVRVFRHDEFPRYLPSAFPYYLSVFTVLVGTILFTVLFLHVENTPVRGSKTKKD